MPSLTEVCKALHERWARDRGFQIVRYEEVNGISAAIAKDEGGTEHRHGIAVAGRTN